MAKSPKSAPLIANVHRFRNTAGVYVGDNNGTAYLSAREAREIGQALLAIADSIEREAFTDSNCPSVTITTADRRL